MSKEEMTEADRTQKMKNKVRILKSAVLMFFLSSWVINCTKEANGKGDHNALEVDSIRPVIARQIEAGASEEYGSFNDYTQEDLDALIRAEKVILDQNGFKPVSSEEFEKKISEIFGRKIKSGSPDYLKLNFNDKCDTKLTYIPFTTDHQDIYISKKDRIITFFYPLPLFLDYTTFFPELKKLENAPIEFAMDGEKMYAQRWRDITNLTELRSKNIFTTAARNKYFFNNDKTALTWMLDNDKDFLKRLVAEFGYDKEEKINTLVLRLFFDEYSTEDDMSLGKLARIVFVKNCDGKLQIRKGLLNSIEKSTTEDNDKYITALGDYIISYLYKEGDNKFTPNEKAEIVAHIANIEGPAFHKYKGESDTAWKQTATPLFFLQSKTAMNHPEVIDLIRKNNYFGLQPLKEYIESGQLAEEDPAFQKKNNKNK